MEKQKIRIKDVPYIYLDIDIIEGDITEVSANILNIRQNLHLAYLERQKNVPAEKFTPFELYEEIYIKRDYNDLDLEIEVYRLETDEECREREELQKKRSNAIKKAAKERKLKQAQEELKLYNKLKAKYEAKE
jgi:hypothetical protein